MTTSLMNWDPFRELDDMQERMNRLFSRSFAPLAGTVGLPATDIYEEADRLVVETALPSFKEDEVEVQLNQNRLEIKAEHAAESENKDRHYLRRESSTASYYRQFQLPEDVDIDSADARFENGVLRVSFAKAELPAPKKLRLGSGNNEK